MRIACAVVLACLVAACSSGTATYVRDTDSPGLDEPAMSTALDRKDLERVFFETATDLVRSRFYDGMRAGGQGSGQATIAILPMWNDTSEHIEAQLETLLSRFEDQLVADAVFAVVSNERRAELLADAAAQQADAFDPKYAARWGRQMGAQFVVTGKVQDVAERTSDMRRVQYSLFMQVIEVETGRIAWMRSSDVTKALVAF